MSLLLRPLPFQTGPPLPAQLHGCGLLPRSLHRSLGGAGRGRPSGGSLVLLLVLLGQGALHGPLRPAPRGAP